jgi:hypothetical protein
LNAWRVVASYAPVSTGVLWRSTRPLNWFASNATVAGTCERLNVNIEELKLVLEIENTFIYIAFNSATPDSIIAAVNL